MLKFLIKLYIETENNSILMRLALRTCPCSCQLKQRWVSSPGNCSRRSGTTRKGWRSSSFIMLSLGPETIRGSSKGIQLNPILHTAWLDSHALTLERNTVKLLFWWKIQLFAYLPEILSWIKESLSQVQKHFTSHVTSGFNIRCTCIVQKPSHIWMLHFEWLQTQH